MTTPAATQVPEFSTPASAATRRIDPADPDIAVLLAVGERVRPADVQDPPCAGAHRSVRLPALSHPITAGAFDRLVEAGRAQDADF